MAARAAVARLGFADAVSYLTDLINDTNCPPNLVPQALFELGDARAAEPAETNRPLANFDQAIQAFSNLRQFHPTNELSLLALGRIGDCYLQLATRDPTRLESAAQAYGEVLTNRLAGVAARSQAECGLALVLDTQARRKANADQVPARKLALQHYLNVVYEKNLRDGESADPFWVKKAGLEAARLAEELQLWEQAALLYDRLVKLLPPLAPSLESRIQKAREHLANPLR